mmetsp:Transcript_85710/g.239573  ORF Transcript_85710/g.239573 Transcript_85710/m.239573 type:complete len:292 (-) Transcript_85710:1820-2695(-)
MLVARLLMLDPEGASLLVELTPHVIDELGVVLLRLLRLAPVRLPFCGEFFRVLLLLLPNLSQGGLQSLALRLCHLGRGICALFAGKPFGVGLRRTRSHLLQLVPQGRVSLFLGFLVGCHVVATRACVLQVLKGRPQVSLGVFMFLLLGFEFELLGLVRLVDDLELLLRFLQIRMVRLEFGARCTSHLGSLLAEGDGFGLRLLGLVNCSRHRSPRDRNTPRRRLDCRTASPREWCRRHPVPKPPKVFGDLLARGGRAIVVVEPLLPSLDHLLQLLVGQPSVLLPDRRFLLLQ